MQVVVLGLLSSRCSLVHDQSVHGLYQARTKLLLFKAGHLLLRPLVVTASLR